MRLLRFIRFDVRTLLTPQSPWCWCSPKESFPKEPFGSDKPAGELGAGCVLTRSWWMARPCVVGRAIPRLSEGLLWRKSVAFVAATCLNHNHVSLFRGSLWRHTYSHKLSSFILRQYSLKSLVCRRVTLGCKHMCFLPIMLEIRTLLRSVTKV